MSISPRLPKCDELSKMIPGSFPLIPYNTSDIPGKHSSCFFHNHSDACVESTNWNRCKSGHTRRELCKLKTVKHLCSSISQSLRIHPGNKCKENDKNFDVTCKHQIIHSMGNVATSITHCHTFRSISESIREKNLTNVRDVTNPLPITRVFNHIRESRLSENIKNVLSPFINGWPLKALENPSWRGTLQMQWMWRIIYQRVRGHTGEKPHRCKERDKCFYLLLLVEDHYRVHPVERAYKCSQCRKCFARSSDLNTY